MSHNWDYKKIDEFSKQSVSDWEKHKAKHNPEMEQTLYKLHNTKRKEGKKNELHELARKPCNIRPLPPYKKHR